MRREFLEAVDELRLTTNLPQVKWQKGHVSPNVKGTQLYK